MSWRVGFLPTGVDLNLKVPRRKSRGYGSTSIAAAPSPSPVKPWQLTQCLRNTPRSTLSTPRPTGPAHRETESIRTASRSAPSSLPGHFGSSRVPNHCSTSSEAFLATDRGSLSDPSRVRLAACRSLGRYCNLDGPQPTSKLRPTKELSQAAERRATAERFIKVSECGIQIGNRKSINLLTIGKPQTRLRVSQEIRRFRSAKTPHGGPSPRICLVFWQIRQACW